MKKTVLFFVISVFSAQASAFACECTQTREAFDYESITVADSAVAFTDATWDVDAPATCAQVTIETAQIRYRADGTAPTSSEGHILEAGDTLCIDDIGRTVNINDTQFIRTGSTSATAKVTYWR